MNDSAMNDNTPDYVSHTRPLIGQAVFVAQPYLSASKGGRVIDVMPLAEEYLIKHDSGQEWWYGFDEVVALTPIEAEAAGWQHVGYVDREPVELLPIGGRETEIEHNHAADELATTAAIEAAMSTPTVDTVVALLKLRGVTGRVTRPSRIAYVPKGL